MKVKPRNETVDEQKGKIIIMGSRNVNPSQQKTEMHSRAKSRVGVMRNRITKWKIGNTAQSNYYYENNEGMSPNEFFLALIIIRGCCLSLTKALIIIMTPFSSSPMITRQEAKETAWN